MPNGILTGSSMQKEVETGRRAIFNASLQTKRKNHFWLPIQQKEQEAMEREVRSQLAEWSRKNMMEIDAMFLWFMHDEFGFGLERLRRVYFGFRPYMEELAKRYEMKGSDTPFLCTKKLLDYGVDLEKWDKEVDQMVEE